MGKGLRVFFPPFLLRPYSPPFCHAHLTTCTLNVHLASGVMGKQNKKSALLAIKKRHHDVKINPFEVRINRKKREVLGQRRDRSERGLPGVSRSRAIEKVYNSIYIYTNEMFCS